MFAGTGTGEFMWPVIHIGDREGFNKNFEEQVVATVIAGQEVATEFSNFFVPLSRSLQMVLIPSIAENFAVGGRPHWAPLKPETVAKRGSSEPILVVTGALRDAVTSRSAWTVTYVDVFPNDAAIPHYGRYHQTGTRFMAQREFMSFQPSDLDLIETIFAMWAGEVIAGHWGEGEGSRENGMPGFFEGD